MVERVRQLEARASEALEDAGDEAALERARVAFLGRKSELNTISRSLRDLPEAERRAVGKAVNDARARLTNLLEERRRTIAEGAGAGGTSLDLTLPGRLPWVGSKHPLIRTLERLEEIFSGLGFEVAVGPHVEDEFHNFDALNIAADHPARDDWDTFYVEGGLLLRTHTSPVQIRVMEARRPPVRIIAPGRVFRNETPDASHASEFFQLEGLYVDHDVGFAELKGVLTSFIRQLFGPDVGIRLRPGFFPFTEPSAEVDVECRICRGGGCGVCKGTGWVELLGSGMVDPRVFRAVGYDPDEVSGYAFGLGVDRICMMLSGVDDIRLFLENDVRFLRRV